MAYLDEDHAAQGDVAIATFPAAAAPGNGVSMAAALRYAIDALLGSNGVVTYPASAAPANGVSLAEVLRAAFDYLQPKTITGETDIDDSAQTETTPFVILTIAPAASNPLADVEICLDLDKATAGFGAIETSVTIQFALERKIDGTNWRREPYVEAALSGTNAAALDRMVRLQAGSVGVTEQVRVVAVTSSDVASDIEIPYAINYKGFTAPTVTPVAAG